MMAGGLWQTLKARGATLGMAGRVAALLVGVYLIGCLALAWWWDYEPDTFAVQEFAAAHAEDRGRTRVIGYTTTVTLIHMADTLLEKRGGYVSNDLFPPGVWMDNVPNWEFGVLTQIRDAARAFRIDFSRSQSQSTEDPDLSVAEGKFFFDNSSWAFPQSESEYRDGIRLFEDYLDRLADPNEPNAQFYARADNLRAWLEGVETRLGSLSQRLSASVGKRQLNVDLAGDPGAAQATRAPAEETVRTPWMDIDDVFFEARGQTWALLHFLKAMEHDFGDVLDKKNARVSLQQIIRELESTQDTIWSPVILNGDGLGLLANHSLVMASYISRANAAISDLRQLLAQG
ncbi:MAG: hypothetical protein CMD39_00240 [Gammaproteobacteria bacterium]|nr:hypothetical protein [Gammaproteobacteria bacterium]